MIICWINQPAWESHHQRLDVCVSEWACKSTDCNTCMFPCPLCKCVQVWPHLRLHSFRGGVRRIKERVFAYAACCLQRGSSQRKISEVDKEKEDKSVIVGSVGERACVNWGVGENWQRKSWGWFPVGIKALRSLHAYSLKMGEENNTQGTGAMLRNQKEKEVCISETVLRIQNVSNSNSAQRKISPASQRENNLLRNDGLLNAYIAVNSLLWDRAFIDWFL